MTRERANCASFHRHDPHDWDYKQVEGGGRTFYYHCPGIKEITIVTWEDE